MTTILLVDDDVAFMERIATLLTDAGYTLLRASRMPYAEMLIAEQKPDLVLLDPDIGHGDGWLLLNQFAQTIPIIVVSGQALEEDIIRGLEAGAVDYLPKPVRSGELLARMRVRLRTGLPYQSTDPAPLGAEMRTSQTSFADLPELPNRRERRMPVAPGDDDNPVFIPHGEEQRLIRDAGLHEDEDIGDISQLPLGKKLHAARQRKRISLVQAELETRPSVRMHYIQAMEEEKFALLPRGPVAEELLRTYAAYIGVDVNQAIDEYRRLHWSTPIEPPVALGGTAPPWRPPRFLIRLLAVILAVLVGGGAIWFYDPNSVIALAERARTLVVPPSATPTLTPSATPTATPIPTEQLTPTVTPRR